MDLAHPPAPPPAHGDAGGAATPPPSIRLPEASPPLPDSDPSSPHPDLPFHGVGVAVLALHGEPVVPSDSRCSPNQLSPPAATPAPAATHSVAATRAGKTSPLWPHPSSLRAAPRAAPRRSVGREEAVRFDLSPVRRTAFLGLILVF
ncbi:lysine-rich arabinogalactan protein 19-like [Miscanthus floridulus]|uniref:lysine-rich arabinogalactan protein 19-like n=1 Tax=Miscanthus floridulus TaxID=154761 RepID=UPI003457B682